MTRKKYEYRKPNDYCSETIYEETRDLEGDKTMGTLIKVVYWDECCQVVKVNWGADIDYEYSRDGEVEMTLVFDEENTKKLMLRTGTHNGADMVSAMAERFNKYGASALEKIEEFCKMKEIQYSNYVHY
jgi:hypothetical protein